MYGSKRHFFQMYLGIGFEESGKEGSFHLTTLTNTNTNNRPCKVL